MSKQVRTTEGPGKAKPFRHRSAKSEALSPTLAHEISGALELLRGTKKAEGAAWEMGWSQSTWYERVKAPLSLTIEELLRLVVLTPDPKFNARIRGHLAALDMHQAIAEHEAGETYVRVNRITFGQPSLPFGDKR
jgi:hypothetical protein